MKASIVIKGSAAGYTVIRRSPEGIKASCLMDKPHALRLAAAICHRHTRRAS